MSQALARHQQLIESDASPQGSLPQSLPAPPDGLVLAAGSELDTLPQLVASPVGSGGNGVRLLHTLYEAESGPVLRLGVLGDSEAQRHWTLESTELAAPLGPGQIYASVQRRHWGPAWSGSLILDAAAPAVPAVGWRKTSSSAFEHPWLAWLGPWNADFFIGRLSGHAEPAHPNLVGMRVEIQPLPPLQLGLSRTLQWGGHGRDQSLSSLWRGLIGKDNEGSSEEPGNQLAGIDARWHWSPTERQSMALYGQLTGEDEAGYRPAKNMKLGGLEWSMRHNGGSLRLFAERAHVVAGPPGTAYRHHIYRQGYTQNGLPLGYPSGGDTKLTSLGALLDGGALKGELIAYRGRALNTAQRLAAGSLSGLNAAMAWSPSNQWALGLSLWSGRDGNGRDTAAQLWWQQTWH
ncbi:capsule assembly Wzi family protein [Azohydromonas caseinilytica]|uniref:Capsule assembly Wzi family protein n=1 Tax=Azohydromonas caseinilytica TaxID=2728836 RepID=A0A848F8G7_9BURK|nr:capsule assembly Wzi family protein [Azohydromonas caseinilytica]NML15066.1 capsule assembly Wzi family protein [Azohydromonas caseinilytica]